MFDFQFLCIDRRRCCCCSDEFPQALINASVLLKTLHHSSRSCFVSADNRCLCAETRKTVYENKKSFEKFDENVRSDKISIDSPYLTYV